MKAEEIINKEIDFTNDRLKNAPFVITKLECKLLMESFSKFQNKELIETLKDEQARIVLLSDGYEDLEVQHKRYLNVLKIYLESALESINSKNQQK